MSAECIFWGTAAEHDGTNCTGPSFTHFIMMAFFMLWNFMCSQLLLVPIFRFAYFGCNDVQGRRSLITLICPHWIVGIAIPFWQGGVFLLLIVVLIPYGVCGYKINKLCIAERIKGKMIKVREEMDLFVDGKKYLRISSVRVTDDRLMFTASGKSYHASGLPSSFDFLLDPSQLKLSNKLISLFGRGNANSIMFTDKRGKNIKMMLTRLVGVDNVETEHVEPAEIPVSFAQNIVRMASTDYQFTAVASALPPNNRNQRTIAWVNGLIPTQPIIPVVSVVAPDIENGNAIDSRSAV